MKLIAVFSYLLRYLLAGNKRNIVSLSQAILIKTGDNYNMLLSIKNNGPGLLMIDTIEVIVDCRDSLKSHNADFVRGIDICLFPGDSIGAVCIISGENDIKKYKPIKIVIKNSLGKKYCFEKEWVRDIKIFEEGSVHMITLGGPIS